MHDVHDILINLFFPIISLIHHIHESYLETREILEQKLTPKANQNSSNFFSKGYHPPVRQHTYFISCIPSKQMIPHDIKYDAQLHNGNQIQ